MADIPYMAQALATTLAPALPYLLGLANKAAEGTAGQIGKEVWENAKKLWLWIRPKVEKEPAIEVALQEVGKDPDNEIFRSFLAQQLQLLLSKDPVFATETGQLLINMGVLNQTQVMTIASDHATVIHIHGDVNQNVTKILQAMDVDKREDLRQATEAYLQFLLERYQNLDFRGMGVSDKVPLRLPLPEMYVPLKARIEMPKGETWDREEIRLRLAGREFTEAEIDAIGERLGGPRSLLGLLEDHEGLVVLGDPGAGKTTILKWLALKLAMGQGDELGLGARLPFLVPLSAYATVLAETDVHLVRFIAEYAEERGLALPVGSILEKALAEGRALILLDGLDEVRELSRRNEIVGKVEDFFAQHRDAGNRFVLTSRVVGYREVRLSADGLRECTLVDFEDGEIEEFVDKWTAAVERAATGESRVAALAAEREQEELLRAVHNHPGVRTLAANPLLLTILALMKRQGVELPERRVELYQKYVETLLKHWSLARGMDPRKHGRDQPVDVLAILRVLAPLALWMQEQSPGVGLVKEVEMRDRLQDLFRERNAEDPDAAAREFVCDLREHAGLLLDRGGRQFGFIHLTFQEYLAAWALADQAQEDVGPLLKALAKHLGEPEWREVSLLAVGCLGVIQQRDRTASTVIRKLIGQAPGTPGEALILASDAVADVGSVGVTPEARAHVVNELLKAIRNDEKVTVRFRAAAGERLARLGDRRFSEKYWSLPDDPLLGFVEVPAGPFLMGSDPASDGQAYENEQPQNELDLPGFFVSRYPVTVDQWCAFVELSGHETSDKASLRGLSNHPITSLSWYDALAYCQWLNEALRELAVDRLSVATDDTERRFWGGLSGGELSVTLPSESEWEKAARGTDGRTYPWGEEASPELASYGETGLGGPSTVGCFPSGASSYGCEEMSGNVWEWTRSSWGEYPYPMDGSREDWAAGDDAWRVLRGGSFVSDRGAARCAFRDWYYPELQDWNNGFRVVCSPFKFLWVPGL